MSVVDAVARVAQLQSELASLRTQSGQSTQSAGASAFAALLGTVTNAAAAPAATAAQVTPAAQSTDSGTQVTGQQIVQDAEQYLGVPYVFGGESTSGMDCSGLVQKVLGDLGISAPRVVTDQSTIGTPVASLADAQPGDLIVEKGNAHIQIYAGDGMIIEAPKPGENVVKRKEWLSADQIGTIRRVATAPSGTATADASAVPAPATSDASAQLSALLAPMLMQQSALAGALTDSGDDDSAAASFTALDAVNASATASLAAALLPGMPGGADAAAAAATACAPAPATPVAPLTPQLSGPITQLVTQPDGSHSVVVRVVPEQLGPVTVDAQLTDHGLHIELNAPSDAGRDALTGVLGDLRRDLAAGGITASVSLGSSSTSSSGGDGQSQASAQQALFELFDEQRSGRVTAPSAATATTAASALLSPDSLLDVLA